jgi:hypothetical protein
MLFLHLADLDAVQDALCRRIGRLDELIVKLDPLRTDLAPILSTGGEHLLDHLDQQRRLDREWLKALLADLQKHGIRDVADPSALAARS